MVSAEQPNMDDLQMIGRHVQPTKGTLRVSREPLRGRYNNIIWTGSYSGALQLGLSRIRGTAILPELALLLQLETDTGSGGDGGSVTSVRVSQSEGLHYTRRHSFFSLLMFSLSCLFLVNV